MGRNQCYFQVRPMSFESICLSLELYTLITCNKGQEHFSSGLVLPSILYYFIIMDSICKCKAQALCCTKPLKDSCFLLRYWEKNVFIFYIIYLKCRRSLPCLIDYARCNQNLIFLTPAPFAREESMFCSSAYCLGKVNYVENKIGGFA